MKGYIKLHRTLFNHWLWENSKVEPAMAFIDLLQIAAYVPTKRVVKSKLIHLKIGELIASERFLEKRWNWSRTKVRNFMENLRLDQMLDQRKDQGQTVLILCNYSDYADGEKQKEPDLIPSTIPEKNHTSTTRVPHENLIKEGLRIEKKEREVKTPAHDSISLIDTSIDIQGEPLPRQGDEMQQLKTRINGLRPEWGKPAAWSYQENRTLFEGAAAQIQELDDDDWKLLKLYLNAKHERGKGFWDVKSRKQFCESFSEVWGHVTRWAEKQPHRSTPSHQSGTSASDFNF